LSHQAASDQCCIIVVTHGERDDLRDWPLTIPDDDLLAGADLPQVLSETVSELSDVGARMMNLDMDLIVTVQNFNVAQGISNSLDATHTLDPFRLGLMEGTYFSAWMTTREADVTDTQSDS
jgi:hypothetical protein